MLKMGPTIIDRTKSKVEFRVFAYNKEKVELVITAGNVKKIFPMQEESAHIYSTTIEGMGLDLLYKFRINGEEEYPDPYSNYQPFGVHDFSQLIPHDEYLWEDRHWQGKNLEDLITMEIHTGTFTSEGTFRAAIDKLDYIAELGINAIEIMPVTQTPGKWNWGYDGANLFSVNHNYGTPNDLKFFIDSCHQKDIAVILDVVYNHFGPEDNYLHAYGPYFTDKHKTPWGAAVNFDDEYCEYTRKMVLDNVRYWLETFHFDGLRLDAVNTIKDNSNPHILKEISDTVNNCAQRQNSKKFAIAESDENNVILITPSEDGGYGIDAQWVDDFHHCIHTALTRERQGYYMDYGNFQDFQKIFKNYLYTGEYSSFWQKHRGTDASDVPGKRFVVCIQNHDQVGNRALGDRLSTLVPFPYLKAAAGLMFFSPYLPLIFMGEEYGEKNPFLFFTDYQDPELQSAVTRGRREEFKAFLWDDIPIPDPQDSQTFYDSKLTLQNYWNPENYQMLNFYKDFISLRRTHPVLNNLDKNKLEVDTDEQNKIIKITRWNSGTKLTALFNLGSNEVSPEKLYGKEILNSAWEKYSGQKPPNDNKLHPGQVIIFEEELQ